MPLLHRTNHRGRYVEPRISNKDSAVYDFDYPVLWVQAVEDGDYEGCCKSFGSEVVEVGEDDFDEWNDEYDLFRWHLWEIDSHRGGNSRHYFHNFILVAEPRGYDKITYSECIKKGWTKRASWNIDYADEYDDNSVDQWLLNQVEGFWDMDRDINHTHIALLLPDGALLEAW